MEYIPTAIQSIEMQENSDTPAKKTYTVKYIGVVEGSMGILSRKMRMPKFTEASVYEQREHSNIMNENEQTLATSLNGPKYTESTSRYEVKQSKNKARLNQIALGGFTKRNIIIDKPLLSSKHKHEMNTKGVDTGYSRINLQDDATSMKPAESEKNQVIESDDGTRTPDITVQPTQISQKEIIKSTCKESSALAQEYSPGDHSNQIINYSIDPTPNQVAMDSLHEESQDQRLELTVAGSTLN